MKTYLNCSYDECIARASAYHHAGHDWANAALHSADGSALQLPEVIQHAHANDPAGVISAAGLLAEAYSYMVDCAEGDLSELDESDWQAHLDAAVMYAAQGLHCDRGDHSEGVDWMSRCPCCAAALASALLASWSDVLDGAEAHLNV